MDWLRKICAKKQSAYINDDLETFKEKTERWKSIYIIYFTMFLMSLGFSIVLTGVWPYLDKLDRTAGKEYMGYVVAANPLGQMLFSPLVGWWGNKRGSVRLPLLITLLLFICASAMYSILEILPGDRKALMASARFLVGVSSG
ncbi:major facilitator superfamily domain-containing protein 8 [Vespula squamosa]|uniref:Major facilitator superfamily domain-containing protein 8 n=1 Tax=Vespula squamosa TaxID=30214 RepID=A0ABD2B2Q4_VESSQ